jgi:hypothetical protein
MAEQDVTECYHPTVVEAFAEAWASIDGKLDAFNREKGGAIHYNDPTYTGHYEGYMAEANELLGRAGKRIEAFDLFTRLDPSP